MGNSLLFNLGHGTELSMASHYLENICIVKKKDILNGHTYNEVSFCNRMVCTVNTCDGFVKELLHTKVCTVLE